VSAASWDAPVLVLEAATCRASVAVVLETRVLGEAEAIVRAEPEDRLMPAVAAALRAAGVAPGEIAALVCGAGPGAFTSLRIAAAIAKGMSAGIGAPMMAVSSLALMVAGVAGLPPGRYLASLDALRGERFAALVTLDVDRVVAAGATMVLPAQSVTARAEALGTIPVGPGCVIDAWPVARAFVRARDTARVVDVASWEPDYGRLPEAEARLAAQ
jgi:tRNA threonylcarbamoyladenosine biosynthesis protein TsaB